MKSRTRYTVGVLITMSNLRSIESAQKFLVEYFPVRFFPCQWNASGFSVYWIVADLNTIWPNLSLCAARCLSTIYIFRFFSVEENLATTLKPSLLPDSQTVVEFSKFVYRVCFSLTTNSKSFQFHLRKTYSHCHSWCRVIDWLASKTIFAPPATH
jgi:hypothetical protein